jgi:hypothetical protein
VTPFYVVDEAIACRTDLTATAKLAIAYLTFRDGIKDHWRPGLRRIAKDIGCSKTAVSMR